jgi:hypothetical protein
VPYFYSFSLINIDKRIDIDNVTNITNNDIAADISKKADINIFIPMNRSIKEIPYLR